MLSYSPAGRKGQTIGANYLVRDGVVSLAYLLAALLWKLGRNVNFGSAAAAGAIGTVSYAAMLRPREGMKVTAAGFTRSN